MYLEGSKNFYQEHFKRGECWGLARFALGESQHPGTGQTLTQIDCFDYFYFRNLLTMCEKGTLRITSHSCSTLNRTSISPSPKPRKHCEEGGRKTEFLATACDTVIATTDKSSRGNLHKTRTAQRQGRREGTGYEEELQEWWRRKGNGGEQEYIPGTHMQTRQRFKL